MNGQPGLPRCQHGVWIVPADWSLQTAHGIPASKRVAWHCFVCRDCGAGEFSEEALLEIARESCETTQAAA